jgi:hypothetical protein
MVKGAAEATPALIGEGGAYAKATIPGIKTALSDAAYYDIAGNKLKVEVNPRTGEPIGGWKNPDGSYKYYASKDYNYINKDSVSTPVPITKIDPHTGLPAFQDYNASQKAGNTGKDMAAKAKDTTSQAWNKAAIVTTTASVLNFASGGFLGIPGFIVDAVTGGYGLKKVQDLGKAISDQRNVIKSKEATQAYHKANTP